MMITKAVATITTMTISGGLKSTGSLDGGDDDNVEGDDWVVDGEIAGAGEGDNLIMTKAE